MLQLAFAIYDIVSYFILTAFCPINLNFFFRFTELYGFFKFFSLCMRYGSVNSKRIRNTCKGQTTTTNQ